MKPETNQAAACTAPATKQKTEKEGRRQKIYCRVTYFRVPPPHYPARPLFPSPFSLSRQSVGHPSVIHPPHVRASIQVLFPLNLSLLPPLSLSKISFRSKPDNQPGQPVSPASDHSPSAPTLHTQQSRCSSCHQTSREVAIWVLHATPKTERLLSALTIWLFPQMPTMTTRPSQTLKTVTSKPRLRGTTRRPASGMRV